MAIPSPATQQESSSRPSEDIEIRHTQEKALVGRQVLALLSFLKPFFRVTVEKYAKFLQRIIQEWYFFKSTTIIVSKETTGIRPDDTISAYNGGKLNFAWPTENLNFAPRMRMLNSRPSPFNNWCLCFFTFSSCSIYRLTNTDWMVVWTFGLRSLSCFFTISAEIWSLNGTTSRIVSSLS